MRITYLLCILFSSSPIDRRLSRDLVVVSHWEAGHKPTSPKNSAPWRNRAPKIKTGKSLAIVIVLNILLKFHPILQKFNLISFSVLQKA